MNLNESYRYMNFLTLLLDNSQSLLNNRSFITTTKQEHMRQKANANAENETITVPSGVEIEVTPMQVVEFAKKVLAEQTKLSTAIVAAKRTVDIDIDNAISMNKKTQNLIYILKRMTEIHDKEKITQGRGYLINPIDGNQTGYIYDIKEVISIDFDRNDVKGIIKSLSKKCDDISTELDKIQIDTLVDYEPVWDVSDTFEDAILG